MVLHSEGITLMEPQVGHFPAQSHVEKDMTKMQRPSPSGKFLVQWDGACQDIPSNMKEKHSICFILQPKQEAPQHMNLF